MSKRSELEILKAFPQWKLLANDLAIQAETLHNELTAIDYNRNNDKTLTIDDVKRAELAILNMLIELPNTLIDDLESVIEEQEEKELEEEQD